MSSHVLGPHFLLLLLFFFLLLLSPSHFLSAASALSPTNTTNRGWPPSTCGNDVKIEFPFWIHLENDSSTECFCGYESLEIVCEGETPIFPINKHKYIVKKIDAGLRTIRLTDPDLMKNSSCPRDGRELNLRGIPILEYAPGVVNLTFCFRCHDDGNNGSDDEHPFGDGSPVTYLDNCDGKSFVFAGPIDPKYKELTDECDDGKVVVAPVHVESSSTMNNNNLSSQYPSLLQGGFELQWKEGDGAGAPSVCDCDDKSVGWSCAPSKGKPNKAKYIAIGLSVGLPVCVTVVILYWCKRRKDRKRQSAASCPVVRSISSDPSAFNKDTKYQSSHHLTHIFTYPELEDATDGFHSSKEIGDGGFGRVYKGELRDGRTVAVKRLFENNYRRMEQFMNEIQILSQLRHPNLVALYGGTSRQSRELLLVYEYVANGTVADHLHGSRADEKGLTWPVRMSIAVETASVLAYLHTTDPQIVHRDVKTHNILLDGNFHVKVGDFGLSRLFPLDVTHVSTAPQGTPGYVDPEYHQCYQLTDKSDVYSFGVVLVELISSKPAVDITRNRSEINLSNMAIAKIRDGLVHELADPELGFECDPEVTRMIRSAAELAFLCLQAERDMRPSMEEVKNKLIVIAAGDRRGEVYVDVDKHTKDDAYLLHQSVPLSPDTVTARWNSWSTTPGTSA